MLGGQGAGVSPARTRGRLDKGDAKGGEFVNGGPVADNLMQEASNWGPWQSVLEDGLAACTVRVRLLGQGLGETSRLTRSEFRAEAAYLYELADELVER